MRREYPPEKRTHYIMCQNCGRVYLDGVEVAQDHHWPEPESGIWWVSHGDTQTCAKCEDHKWRIGGDDSVWVSRINESGRYETMPNDEVFRRLNSFLEVKRKILRLAYEDIDSAGCTSVDTLANFYYDLLMELGWEKEARRVERWYRRVTREDPD